MDTLHKHTPGPGPAQGHGHGHGHLHTDAPPTTGRLIRWARFYDPLVWLLAGGQTRALRTLPLDLAAIQPGERVLDVGCGTGDLTLAAARRVGPGGTVTGIDAALEMIAVAQGKARRAGGKVQFRVEPVEAMSFPDGAFDVVLSSLMMHHLPGDLPRRALIEIRRVLRPGGRVVIVDAAPNGGPRPIWAQGGLAQRLHGRHPAPAATEEAGLVTLAALLRETGFEAVKTGPTRNSWLGYAKGRVPD